MKYNVLLLLLLIVSVNVFSQKAVLSGFITDAGSGEALIGANIIVKETAEGTTANNYGFFSLELSKGKHELQFSYVGYTSAAFEIDISKDTILKITLKPAISLDEIEITAEGAHSQVKSSRMGTVELPVVQIKKLPRFFGEPDVLKTLQLLPGVQSGTEGTSGLYVRGGGADQNLILLDGVPVYNADHLFGFFSVFNPDAINHIELVKGGFPARFGGRLSSVIDIRMKEGNMNKIKATGSLGLISSKLTIEGPILKGKTSFIVSGRRSYIDYLAQPIMSIGNEYSYNSKTGYYFSDVNAKINHTFSLKDRIFLSFYSGTDKFYQNQPEQQYLYNGTIYEESGKSHLGWGNLTGAFRWSHQYNGKLFGNATLTYSKYHFGIDQDLKTFELDENTGRQTYYKQNYSSGILDVGGKYDFDYIPSSSHYIKIGTGYVYHIFSPGASVTSSTVENDPGLPELTTISHDDIHASEYYAYAEDDFRITEDLKMNAGVRFSGFKPGKKNYMSFEPRLSLVYLVAPKISVKGSYSYMTQYIHLLTNNNIGLPTDLWVPATDNVPPLNSSQYSAGVNIDLPKNLRFTFESYYKTMNNVIEYKEGSSFLANFTNWESKVESGKGWSYGAEFFLEKPTGVLTGWIGYTWANSNRQFPTINSGRVFPYKYDRRHDISLVVNYKIDDSWDVSFTWVYGSGNAITMPTVNYRVIFDNGYVSERETYFERNSFRSAAYHRLDIGFNHTKKKKWGERTWSFGLYNAYNRKNPFYYNITTDQNNRKVLERVSIFPVIPSVNYSFTIGK